MRKIAVYGGTFNPIHNGHIHLAEQFKKLIGFDKVVLIPTNVPPHKEALMLASAEDRLQMCRLAALDAGFEVSDMEIKRSGRSYTADTLELLKKQEPEAEFYLMMGEDMFLTLLSWRRPDKILKLSTICAAPRSWQGLKKLEEYAEKLKERGGRVVLGDIEYLPVSSTMVRDCIREGKDVAGLVPRGVAEYIKTKHLYEESLL